MKRGHVVGNKMAGLAGGTESIKLKETGVSLNLPTYDLHHLAVSRAIIGSLLTRVLLIMGLKKI